MIQLPGCSQNNRKGKGRLVIQPPFLKEEFYEKISKIRNWQFVGRLWNSVVPQPMTIV